VALTICDDGHGLLRWRVSERTIRDGFVLARSVRQPITTDPKGCKNYAYGWTPTSKFWRPGRYQVGVRVTDSGRLSSNLITKGYELKTPAR
jgi:hypothetical protein